MPAPLCSAKLLIAALVFLLRDGRDFGGRHGGHDEGARACGSVGSVRRDQAVARALFLALGKYWETRGRLTVPFVLSDSSEVGAKGKKPTA
ncbi:MAG: hypothetical protein LBT53_00450 [Puniceicoccales bacterium]|nr:hypothetical protein [Puniceicoccales bacterium]